MNRKKTMRFEKYSTFNQELIIDFIFKINHDLTLLRLKNFGKTWNKMFTQVKSKQYKVFYLEVFVVETYIIQFVKGLK